jgi:hypothetical protein
VLSSLGGRDLVGEGGLPGEGVQPGHGDLGVEVSLVGAGDRNLEGDRSSSLAVRLVHTVDGGVTTGGGVGWCGGGSGCVGGVGGPCGVTRGDR